MIATARKFAEAAAAADSLNHLRGLLDAITREMGYRHFALSQHVDFTRAPQPAIRLHSYPQEWEAFFDTAQFGPSDPVHRASHLTSVGFTWTMLPRIIVLTARDEEILMQARRLGLSDGFTVPAHIPGESAGSCSFATAMGQSPRHDWLPLAQFVGAAAFDSARRLSGIRRVDGGRPQLSNRQHDCIYWAARGKSDWAISRILGIGHDTAIQHMRRRAAATGSPTGPSSRSPRSTMVR